MSSDPSASPAHSPEDLVAQFLDQNSSPELRNRALAALAPRVREVARQCSRVLIADEQVRRDLVDESLTYFQAQIHHYDRQRPLIPWLRTVLYNLALDLRRNRVRQARSRQNYIERQKARSGLVTPTEEQAGAIDTLAELIDHFAVLRQDLDTCSWQPARTVDYFSVFLVLLRLELARVYRQQSGPLPFGIGEQVACWLPWRPEEEQRRFRTGLPSLGELWRRLAPRLENGPRLEDLLATLNQPEPSGGPVRYATLAQWTFRARQQGKERLGEEIWNTHGFARLLDTGREDA